MATRTRATIEDLYNVPDHAKAELVNGEIVRIMATGGMPGRAGVKILLSLYNHEQLHGAGHALGDNVGFIVDLPNRGSFSPDVAWYTGNVQTMKFLEGSPSLAVEIRSEHDYGQIAERELADKRRDYFAAGTLVVWDVDLLGEDVIRVHRFTDPENPTVYRRGNTAEAEPAVPGWRMAVDELFK